MIKKRLKSQRTSLLEKLSKRCENRHPNYHFVRCEFSVDEFHNQHIGENGHYAWFNETRKEEKRYVTT